MCDNCKDKCEKNEEEVCDCDEDNCGCVVVTTEECDRDCGSTEEDIEVTVDNIEESK